MLRRTLVALLVVLSACGDEVAELPQIDAGAEAQGDQDERDRTARQALGARVLIGGSEVAALSLSAKSLARDVILQDCFESLQKSPGGMPFGTTSGITPGCSYDTMMGPQNGSNTPPSFNSLPTSTDPNACHVALCRAEAALCVSNRLLELSATVTPTTLSAKVDPTKLDGKSSTIAGATPAILVVPPQDSESGVALNEQAFHYAAWAVTASAENLRSGAGRTTTIGTCTSATIINQMAGMSYGEVFASLFTEAALIGSESARAAVKSHVAVAQADYSRIPDKITASKMAWLQPDMSRARAVHLLVGGGLNQGLGDYRTSLSAPTSSANSLAVCPQEPPTGADAQAWELIKISAAYPGLLANATVSFKALWDSGGGIDVPMRVRLAERLGDASLATMSAGEFLERRQLSDNNFRAARGYITQERRAFARDDAATLPPQALSSTRNPDGSLTPRLTTAPIYAATATTVTPPPALHYRAQVRFPVPMLDLDSDRLPVVNDGLPALNSAGGLQTGTVQPTALYAQKSLLGLLDYARTVSAELAVPQGTGSTLPAIAVDLMATYLGAEGSKVGSRLESCYRFVGAQDEFRLRVYGVPTSVGEYVVVFGAAGLRCAVDGRVDGAPCELATYGASKLPSGALTGPTFGTTADAQTGFKSFAEFNVKANITPDSPIQAAYVVRVKPGAAKQPGNFRQVGGIRTHTSRGGPTSTNFRYCTLQPVHDEVQELVEETMTPDPNNCGSAALTCAGTSFVDKLPLESELSDDGNGVESSWRVYLDRARLAADRADGLGEQLLESGLEIDRRIEGSIEEIEALCGEAVGLSDYFPGGVTSYRGGPCTAFEEGQACATYPGTVCRTGTCVADPITILQMRAAAGDLGATKLLQCLGADSLKNVTLGSRPVCIWKDAPGRICPLVPGYPCPYVANSDGTCPPVPGQTPFAITTTLGLFQAPDEQVANPLDPPACSALRELRKPVSNKPREQLIAKLNGHFDPQTLGAYAARIGFEARPLDYAAITLDGTPLFSTGSPFRTNPESEDWPCVTSTTTDKAYLDRDAPADSSCPVDAATSERAASFFCASTQQCGAGGDRIRRARMNHRMARAVLALRILSRAGISESFRGPFYADKEYVLDQADDGELLGRSIEAERVEWPLGQSASNLGNGRGVAFSSALEYVVVEGDTLSGDDVGRWPVDGFAMCFTSTPNPSNDILWTDFPGELTGATAPYTANCETDWLPMFKSYSTSSGDEAGYIVSQVWQGLDGQTTDEPRDGWRRLVVDLLRRPPANQDLVIVPTSTPGLTDLTRYWQDEARSEVVGIDPNTGYPIYGQVTLNPIGISRDGLRARDILDGLELACEVQRAEGAKGADCSDLPPPRAEALQDLQLVEDYMRCSANAALKLAERQVLLDVPQTAIDTLNGGVQLKGELGAAAGEFAAALAGLRKQQEIISSELFLFSQDVRALRLQLRKQRISIELVNLSEASAIANQVTACLTATAGAYSVENGLAGGLAAAATCANTITQIAITLQEADLTEQGIELDGDLSWNEFQTRMRTHATTLQDASRAIEESTMALRAALARIESSRQKGLRELARAMLLGTDASGRHFNVNTVIRRRYNTLLVRYQRAWEDAVRTAWIARRAVEQRLGIELAGMHDDMLLVESPASWVDELCTITGLDYTRIRSENGLDADDYADEYLGDYVRKLDSVVASYEHDFPFHEASDTAVVSLRDDVSLARATCEVSVPNLLAYSARLDVATDPEDLDLVVFEAPVNGEVPPVPAGEAPGSVWTPRNCNLVGSSPAQITDCVRVEALDGSDPANRPITVPEATGGDVLGYRVTFAPGTGASFNPWSSATPSVVAQTVRLERGYHRLSWYGKPGVANAPHPMNLVSLRPANDVKAMLPHSAVASAATSGWSRYHRLYYVEQPGAYLVALTPSTSHTGAHSVDLAAITLENLDDRILGLPDVASLLPDQFVPVQFISTRRAGIGQDAVCEDTDGSVFRTLWSRGCEQLCPTGYGTCGNAPTHCYWELPMDLTLDGLESGQLMAQAGFAYGNFNYRVDRLAVNFVGTGVRDCSDSTLPSTCNASANVPYSIEHVGPYAVRNHEGEIYQAPLFIGHIEHGRGLAAERYITNPISSADRSLLEPYEHGELSGRPLTGHYVLRVWDTDGVSFPHIEDVQIILGYRYWTRFE